MWADVRAAFSFLTVLPFGTPAGRRPGWSFAAFPLVGLCLGALLAAGAAVAPWPPTHRAFVVLVAWVVLTGGLHLDGFGDSCDALLATTTPARRLDIMKDPRAGTWAVVGLVLLLLGKWLALQAVSALPLLLLGPVVAGRWAMVLAAVAFPAARAEGLGRSFRDGLGRTQVVVATATLLAVVVPLALLTHRAVLLLPLVGLLVPLVLGRWAAARLGGGLTGDVYGAICELTELLCLGVLSVIGASAWANG